MFYEFGFDLEIYLQKRSFIEPREQALDLCTEAWVFWISRDVVEPTMSVRNITSVWIELVWHDEEIEVKIMMISIN